MGPFLLGLVASVVGVYLWPDSYVSVATVAIRPQQVPQEMVKAATNQDILDRINSLTQQVLSRSELTNLIRSLNLYPRERNRMPIEDVLELMHRNIRIMPIAPVVGSRNVPAFQVAFTYHNRFDAQKVVSALVSKFIDENIKTRDRFTYQTEDFLRSQTEQAKKRLDEIDRKITEFRLANPGKLPDQLNATMSQLNALQSSVIALTQSLGRAQSEKMQLETNIRIYKDQIAALSRESQVVVAQTAKAKSPRLLQAEQQVENLELQLTALRKQFTENYPQVRNMKGLIETARQHLESVRAEEEAQKGDEPAAQPPVNLQVQREIRNYQANIEATETQVRAKELEIANLEKQLRNANEQVAVLNNRMQSMPVGDQVWNELMREQALAKEEYLRMSQNLNAARVAVEMEGRKQGETLEQLDPASLPVDPTEPNRPLVIAIGAGLGLVLGVVLAGAREIKDTSLKNLKDVRAYTQMPVLGSIPLLENDFVVRRRRRIAWLGWTAASLLSAVVMAGSIVYYYQTRG
jgi:uncharacterized protein involved in exopolysaccharide biosynthesis